MTDTVEITPSEQDELLDLSLDDLGPKKRQVKLGDAYYDVADPNMLGLVDLTESQQLETRFSRALQRFQAHPEDRKAGQDAERFMTALARKAAPGLPEAVAASLSFMQKARLLAFFAGRLADVDEAISKLRERPSTTPTSSPALPSGTDLPTESS